MLQKYYEKLHQSILLGLTGLVKELSLSDWEMKPFPPGHIAEFDILSDGKIKMVSLKRFFNIEKPLLPPAALEEGLLLFN